MCDCINLIDAKLKEADVNTKLDIPIVFSTSGGLSATRALIATAKRDKTNRKKPSLLFAACCPFCGQPYKKGDAPPPKPTAGEAAAERSLNEALDMIRELVGDWPRGGPSDVLDAARGMLLEKVHGGTGREGVDDE